LSIGFKRKRKTNNHSNSKMEATTKRALYSLYVYWFPGPAILNGLSEVHPGVFGFKSHDVISGLKSRGAILSYEVGLTGEVGVPGKPF
jgi:hypothetical protein